ncbi:hypothetical protein XENTR_v10015450 [Xenopus tropicalis]|nr:hypothetical protein XENTR_v10015450 [Xenopus tropicalis]
MIPSPNVLGSIDSVPQRAGIGTCIGCNHWGGGTISRGQTFCFFYASYHVSQMESHPPQAPPAVPSWQHCTSMSLDGQLEKGAKSDAVAETCWCGQCGVVSGWLMGQKSTVDQFATGGMAPIEGLTQYPGRAQLEGDTNRVEKITKRDHRKQYLMMTFKPLI